MKRRSVFAITAVITLLMLLIACGPAAETPSTSDDEAGGTVPTAQSNAPVVAAPSDGDQAAYPVEEVPTSAPPAEGAYPPADNSPPEPTPLPENYPAPTEEIFLEPRFQLDLPLTSGATQVSGQAPPGLVLAVVDVTFNGNVLGTGPVDENGRFAIDVEPLLEGNRVGITFAELEPGKDIAQMSEEYFPYRGDEFMNIPNVGIFFDTAIVTPQ